MPDTKQLKEERVDLAPVSRGIQPFNAGKAWQQVQKAYRLHFKDTQEVAESRKWGHKF